MILKFEAPTHSPKAMVLQRLISYFINNNPQLVEKLSETYPIRRAAQLTVYIYRKGRRLTEGAMQDVTKQGSQRIEAFSARFSEELKKGWKEASEEMQKKR